MLKDLKKIRLSSKDLEALKISFRMHFLKNDRLWIFGSRVDVSKKGGDIDLYVETHANSVADAIKMKTNFIWDLQIKIGDQKIDVVLNMLYFPYNLVIHEVAKTEGIRIV